MIITRNSHYALSFLQFLTHILAVPLLPNRIPLSEIPKLVSRIPWEDLPSIVSSPHSTSLFTSPTLEDVVSNIERPSRPHILANLLAFVPPRYAKLSEAALVAYLQLYTALLDAVKPGDLEPPTNIAGPGAAIPAVKQSGDDDSDSDDDVSMDVDQPTSSRVTTTSKKSSPVQVEAVAPLDSRTLSRLATLTAPSHLSSLLTTTSRHSRSREILFR